MTRHIWDSDLQKFVKADEYKGKDLRWNAPKGPAIHSFDPYLAPTSDDKGVHRPVRGKKEEARLMNDANAVDARDVLPSLYNENVRMALGYGD